MRRRRFIQTTVGTAGVATVAGCLGDDDGDDDNGTAPTDDGDQADDDDDDGDAVEGTIHAAMAPVGTNNFILSHLEETGRLDELMNDAGYDYDIELTWGYPSLFASAQVDVVADTPMGLGRMAAAQGIESVSFAAQAKNPLMVSVPTDSQYLDADTPAESLQQAAEDNAVFGLNDWVDGSTIFHQLLYEEWGITHTEQDSEFEVISTEFAAITEMLVEGEFDIAQTTPVNPGHPDHAVAGPNLIPLYHQWDVLDELGFDAPIMVAGLGARADAWEEHREGIVALGQALNEGQQWYSEGMQNQEFHDQEGMNELLGHGSMEASQWYMDFSGGNDLVELYGEEYEPWNIPEQTTYDSYYLTDDIISAHTDFLDQSAQYGLVGDDWADYVTFEQVDEFQ